MWFHAHKCRVTSEEISSEENFSSERKHLGGLTKCFPPMFIIKILPYTLYYVNCTQQLATVKLHRVFSSI